MHVHVQSLWFVKYHGDTLAFLELKLNIPLK